MSEWTNYACGFAFSLDRAFGHDLVLLIDKERGPDVVVKTTNGLGGKLSDLDDGDTLNAMVREFEEECGVQTSCSQWRHFARLTGRKRKINVDFFSTTLTRADIMNIRSTTDEVVGFRKIEDLARLDRLSPHVRWLVPLALERNAVGVGSCAVRPDAPLYFVDSSL